MLNFVQTLKGKDMKKLMILILGAILLASCYNPRDYKKYEVKLPDGSVEYIRAGYYSCLGSGHVVFGPNKIAIYRNFVSIKEVDIRPYER